MKTKLILFVMTLVCTCSTLMGQKTITITDNRKAKADVETGDSNKDKDVKISRVDAPFNNPYLVRMYRMDNGKLKSYIFIVSALDDYDKATYEWVNDTTMTFKLINPVKNISESFEMTGAGDRSVISRGEVIRK